MLEARLRETEVCRGQNGHKSDILLLTDFSIKCKRTESAVTRQDIPCVP